ncbi:MAG TPA: carotenoid biosynthesis protein [Verrucomicrobiae bacterium]|nr:carotenoid biosynthesis protein [Verrucomicrobiae bacterium]
MDRAALCRIALKPESLFGGRSQTIHRTSFALFLIQFGLAWCNLCAPFSFFSGRGWPEGLLLVLGAVTTLCGLARQLPTQNVLAVALLIALMGGVAQSLGAFTGAPFGPLACIDRSEPLLFGILPWSIPLIWIVALLTGRGVSRLMFRPWRQSRVYGFWVLGCTVVLAVLLELALDMYARQIKEYGVWKPTGLPVDWYTTAFVNCLGWAVAAAIILVCVTPFLINKRPAASDAPDYHPLLVWMLFQTLFVTADLKQHLGAAAAVTVAQSFLIAVVAVRGLICAEL